MTAPMAPEARRGVRAVRLRILAALAVLLIAAAVVDRRPARPVPVPASSTLFPPPAAPASALSSSWYCGGATGQAGGSATGTVVVANATDVPLHGTALLIPAGGTLPPVPVAIDVGPLNRALIDETAVNSPYVAAVVDLDGGGAAVEQVVQGPQGFSLSPCWTGGSQRWYFADGTTVRGASLLVAILNPYPENAIVDLSFVSEQGHEAPTDYQGVVIGSRQLVVVDIGAHLPLRQQLATTVSARTGRVVAYQTQVVGPPPPSASPPAEPSPPTVPGLTLTLGAPAPATLLWWPDGLAGDGVGETYRIYNPGTVEAHLQLSLALDQGSAQPFDITVAPGDTTAVVANAESRIPKGVAHAAVLRSLNGVGVVAERSVTATAPSTRSGRAVIYGSGRAARRWLLAGGSAAPTVDEWVVIYNPGPAGVRVSVTGLTGGGTVTVGGLQDLSVASGRRLAVRINDHAPNLNQALEVEASANVVVERDLYGVGQPGLSAVPGVPLCC